MAFNQQIANILIQNRWIGELFHVIIFKPVLKFLNKLFGVEFPAKVPKVHQKIDSGIESDASSSSGSTLTARKSRKEEVKQTSLRPLTSSHKAILIFNQCVAINSTFLFSSLFHEMILMNVIEAKTSMSQFLFFVIHGLLMTLQIVIELATKNTIAWSRVPNFICIPFTSLLFLWTSPLFINEFIREDTIFDIIRRITFFLPFSGWDIYAFLGIQV